MTLLFSHLDSLNLRRSWWIRFQTTPYHCILTLRCFLWQLSTQNCLNSVIFQRISINSSQSLILDNFLFRATSPIHWIRRLPSLLKLKSSIVSHTSRKRWAIYSSLKDKKLPTPFRYLKTKKINKSISKLRKMAR